MIDRDTLIRKVMSRLEDVDYDIVADYVKSNISSPEKLKKYFESYLKRNNLNSSEKRKILLKLKEEKIDLTKPDVKEIFETLGGVV